MMSIRSDVRFVSLPPPGDHDRSSSNTTGVASGFPDALPTANPSNTSFTDIEALSAYEDAWQLRVAVFVHEQGCALENERDADDARSWHWLAYIHNTSSTAPDRFSSEAIDPSPTRPPDSSLKLPAQPFQDSHAAATLRLIPPPHAPHPLPGSHDGVGGTARLPPSNSNEPDSPALVPPNLQPSDPATRFHDGHEPYVKLGRLATRAEDRGQGLATALIETALDWAWRHRRLFDQFPDRQTQSVQQKPLGSTPVGREACRAVAGETVQNSRTEQWQWRGLILIHAQRDVVPFYARLGFERDEELGTWYEEGVEHVAMWRRPGDGR